MCFFCIRISNHQVCKVKVFNEMKARSNRVFRDKLKFKVAQNSFQHLKFRKFKVALNPMYRCFLNFVKTCVLSYLSKVDNIKKFHRAVFEL